MQNNFTKRNIRCVKKDKKNLRVTFKQYLIKLLGKMRKFVEKDCWGK